MADQEKAQNKRDPRLSDILTDEQDAQLAKILAELIAQKFGTLEIEILEGKIRYFRPKKSIDVVYPGK
jgi:hypothetical protein